MLIGWDQVSGRAKGGGPNVTETERGQNTPHGRCGQGPGNVDPRFPAGLPFPVPEILEFEALRDPAKFFQQFSLAFPEFSSGTPEQIPETATAFSSFLKLVLRMSCRKLVRQSFIHTNS